MNENNVIKNNPNGPITIDSLSHDLTQLGVTSGMTVLVHSSLSALGWVCGGAVAVVLALEAVLGPTGTLVVPTHSGDLSDPAPWENPPVPASWWPIIRQNMPAYDPAMTPSRGMGAIPECFRQQDGVLRSGHPQYSSAAWGKHAQSITANHRLAFGLGEQSPLARIYEHDGWVLLLGVGHENNTSLHLAEARATYPNKKTQRNATPMQVEGERQWVEFTDLSWDETDFEPLGAAFNTESGLVKQGQVGQATALLMPQRALVDYGVSWMTRHRGEGTDPKGF